LPQLYWFKILYPTSLRTSAPPLATSSNYYKKIKKPHNQISGTLVALTKDNSYLLSPEKKTDFPQSRSSFFVRQAKRRVRRTTRVSWVTANLEEAASKTLA